MGDYVLLMDKAMLWRAMFCFSPVTWPNGGGGGATEEKGAEREQWIYVRKLVFTSLWSCYAKTGHTVMRVLSRGLQAKPVLGTTAAGGWGRSPLPPVEGRSA